MKYLSVQKKGMVMKENDMQNVTRKEEANQKSQVFQKYNQLIHFGLRGQKVKKGSSKELLTIGFIKKYLHYAKTNIAPVLTQEASDYIATRYSELRTREDGSNDKYRVCFMTYYSRQE
jgi:DNA replication licensing factor MCM3